MKVQGNRYINNPEMIKKKVEKKTTVPQNIISEDDVKISDSARKLVETARNKVSDFHTMHFSSINGEIREIPAEYKCENLFKSFNIIEIILSFNNREVGLWQLQVSITAVAHRIMLQITRILLKKQIVKRIVRIQKTAT